MDPKRRPRINLYFLAALLFVGYSIWQSYGPLLLNKDTILSVTRDSVELDGNSAVAKVRERTGKPTLVYFYGSWCGACRNVTPLLASYARNHRFDGVRLVFIAYDHDAYTLATFLTRKGYDGLWTPYFIPTGPAPELQQLTPLSIAGIPMLLAFDATGKLLTSKQGPLRSTELDAMLEAMKQTTSGGKP